MTHIGLIGLLLKLPLECLLIELCLGKIVIYVLNWNTEPFVLSSSLNLILSLHEKIS